MKTKTAKQRLDEGRIILEAQLRISESADIRARWRRSDWDYIQAIESSAFTARCAGLLHIAKQKEEFLAKQEADTRAIWGIVDSPTPPRLTPLRTD